MHELMVVSGALAVGIRTGVRAASGGPVDTSPRHRPPTTELAWVFFLHRWVRPHER